MKKQLIALLLVLVTLLLVSCGTETTSAVTPTEQLTEASTEAPTEVPTEQPTEVPTEVPTEEPTEVPTEEPTEVPTEDPSAETPTTETPTTETPAIVADPAVLLKGKRMGFFGDSIVHASTHDTDYYPRYGWPGRIGTEYEASLWDNCGQDGASVSTIRGTNTVFAKLRNYRSRKYDFVVLEGGVNDAWDNCKVGTLSDMTVKEFDPNAVDRSTFAGGLEHLLYYTKTYFPNATVLYVLNFKMGSNQGSLMNMRKYIDVTIEACEKWGISYLNLYDDAEFNNKFAITTKTNAVDGIHPNSAGYDLIAPVIAQAMADAYVEQHSK